MTLERFILIAISLISIGSVFYIPKEKYRLALISFLVFRALTWAVIVFLVQTGAIEYPVREFTRATQIGFITNYLFYPMIFVWFILSFPTKESLKKKILHYFIFISVIVWFIYFIAVYTDLENFIKGTVRSQTIRLYLNFSIDFIICHIYILWFSKKTNLAAGGKDHA